MCVSFQLSLTFYFFCVTGTPWAGVFREQSVATVIYLSELSSQITQDSVCQGPARHRPAGRSPARPVLSHNLSGPAWISPHGAGASRGISTRERIPPSSDYLGFHCNLCRIKSLKWSPKHFNLEVNRKRGPSVALLIAVSQHFLVNNKIFGTKSSNFESNLVKSL